MNFIAVGSYGNYYFIDRFLIFNFSCLTEPGGVRKYLEKDLDTIFFYSTTFVFNVLLENN
jgi:small basic protein